MQHACTIKNLWKDLSNSPLPKLISQLYLSPCKEQFTNKCLHSQSIRLFCSSLESPGFRLQLRRSSKKHSILRLQFLNSQRVQTALNCVNYVILCTLGFLYGLYVSEFSWQTGCFFLNNFQTIQILYFISLLYSIFQMISSYNMSFIIQHKLLKLHLKRFFFKIQRTVFKQIVSCSPNKNIYKARVLELLNICTIIKQWRKSQ